MQNITMSEAAATSRAVFTSVAPAATAFSTASRERFATTVIG